jgi:beta-aspartyl-peptidase (threonine type)
MNDTNCVDMAFHACMRREHCLKRAIIVHGGAWKIPKAVEKPCVEGVDIAAELGLNCLLDDASALDAVEVAVRCMEDNPIFDAGVGSVLNAEGEIELDAAIMDGRSLNVGAIAAAKNTRNPISLARRVMENSNHIFLVGEGANKFATLQGFEKFDGLVVEREIDRWKKLRGEYKDTMKFSDKNGTVGAVAIDTKGNIAAATSTGGVPFKLPGRVGDSCLIGCGLYADNQVGGVSATGYGESIIKIALSKVVCDLLENGLTAQKAAEEGIRRLERRINGRGGVIVLDIKGDFGFSYNTPKMARAYMKEGMDGPVSSV